ncbi:MAG: tetratricopeptide repeat protein [Phycisphaerae bacterium]
MRKPAQSEMKLTGMKSVRHLVAALIVSLAGPAAFAANHPEKSHGSAAGDVESAARRIDAANGMLNRGLYDLAEAEYRAALAANVDNATKASAQYGLAICIYRQGRFEDTIAALEPLEETNAFAFGAEVGIMRGQSLLSLGRFEEAATVLKQVAGDHPSHKLASQAIVGAIEALYRSGANEDADKYARQMIGHISHEPTRNRAEILQAAALVNTQDFAKATALLKSILDRKLDENMAAQVRVMLGQCAAQLGQYEQAASWFGAVLSADVSAFQSEAQLGLADALYRLGKVEESKRSIGRILESKPDDALRADATMILGRIHFDGGAFSAAREAFEAVRDLGRANRIEAEYWIAKCALRMGSAREAVELFGNWNKANSAHAMNVEATYDYGVSLIEAEQFDDAAHVLTDFRKRFPDSPLNSAALHLLAVAAYRRGDDAACAELCEAYTKEFVDGPQIADVLNLAIRCTFRAEKWQDALAWAGKFTERFPTDTRVGEANFRAGLAAYRLEAFDDAEGHFARLLVDGEMPTTYAVASLALGDIRFQAGDWSAADRWLSSYLATGPTPPSGDEALLKRAIARRHMDKSTEALADLDALLKRWPDSTHRARALLERGETLALTGDEQAAKLAFAEAGDAKGGESIATQAAFQQAVLAMQDGHFAEAANHLTHFLSRETDADRRAEGLYQRGHCHLASGKFQEAYADFSDITQHQARGLEALAWSFVTLARQDKLADASALWSERVEGLHDRLDARTRATILYERAWALRATGDDAGAVKAYQAVLAIDGSDAALRAHATLGLAEIQVDRDGCAVGTDRLRTLIASSQTESPIPAEVRQRALFRLGSCALEAKEWSEAQGYFAALLEAYPTDANVMSIHLYSGEALMQLGRFSEAREQLEFVTEDCGDAKTCSAAMLRLGECLAAQQQWADSERVLQNFLMRFGDTDVWYQAQFGLAWARENQDRHDDAINAYREVVERHQGPSAARAQFQIGECLFAKGEHEAATREFLKVDILYDYPEWSAASLYEAGRCFESMDRRVEARAQFQDVVDRFGDSKWAGLAEKRIPHLAASVVPGH